MSPQALSLRRQSEPLRREPVLIGLGCDRPCHASASPTRRALSRADKSLSRQMRLIFPADAPARSTPRHDGAPRSPGRGDVALAQITNLSGLRAITPAARHPRCGLDASTRPESRHGPPKSFAVCGRDIGVPILSNTHDVVAELLRKWFGHDDTLPGRLSGLANSDVTYPCSSPRRRDDQSPSRY